MATASQVLTASFLCSEVVVLCYFVSDTERLGLPAVLVVREELW
jgi:hypothetical protein